MYVHVVTQTKTLKDTVERQTDTVSHTNRETDKQRQTERQTDTSKQKSMKYT